MCIGQHTQTDGCVRSPHVREVTFTRPLNGPHAHTHTSSHARQSVMHSLRWECVFWGRVWKRKFWWGRLEGNAYKKKTNRCQHVYVSHHHLIMMMIRTCYVSGELQMYVLTATVIIYFTFMLHLAKYLHLCKDINLHLVSFIFFLSTLQFKPNKSSWVEVRGPLA